MKSAAVTVDDYLAQINDPRKEAFLGLRQTIVDNLPAGFEETVGYGMIAYVVPHSVYPKGYRCNSGDALPFINLAIQKNYISLYHLGIYADATLLDWFVVQYHRVVGRRPDMGKSCIRFKHPGNIPLSLIGELVTKMTVDQWIHLYETSVPPVGDTQAHN
ncbi:MAG: DUF1801 domain-containing protein [Breznakibacter sp.]